MSTALVQWIAAATAAGACAVVAIGAGTIADDPPSTAAVAVAPPPIMPTPVPDGRLTLRLDGTIDDPQPIAQALPMDGIPLASLAPEGQLIAAGAPLAVLDTAIARFRDEEERLRLQQAERTQALLLARLRQRIADLESRQADLRAQERVLCTQLAASASTDQAQLAIAQLEDARTERVFADATAALARVQELVAHGHASPGDLARAKLARDQAEIACVPTRAALGGAGGGGLDPMTRRRLTLELERVRDALGAEGQSGVAADLADLRLQLAQQEALGTEDLARQRHEGERRRALAAHPLVVAQASGVVRYRGSDVQPGARLPAAAFAFILGSNDLVATVQLPEALRARVRSADPADPRIGAASVALGSLGEVLLPAHVRAIASAPTLLPDGRRSFTCAISFDHPGEAQAAASGRLSPGMPVRCELALPVPVGALRIPRWCVADPTHPAVTLVGGTVVRLEGFGAGSDFIVTAGLPAQARIDASAPARAPATHLRLAGVLEAVRTLPIRLASSDWELLEVVPDGSLVEEGQVIARLGKSVPGTDADSFAFAANVGAARARADYDIARADAQVRLSQALVRWQQAEIDAREQALAAIGSGWPDGGAIFQAELARTQASIARDQAERAGAALDDPEAAAAFSRNDLEARRLGLATTALGLEHAQLQLAQAHCSADWLARQAAGVAASEAADAAERARDAYQVERTDFEARVARAEETLRADLARLRWTSDQIADREVRAPRRGRLYHRLQLGWKPLQIGELLVSPEPFVMPVGSQRRVTVEVPERLYRRIHVGDTLPLRLPVLSEAPLAGTVTQVGAWFGPSSDGSDPGTTSGEERVFSLTVACTLTDADADRVPLGTIAYVDL